MSQAVPVMLEEAARITREQISALGVAVATDPRDLDLPGILLMPQHIAYDSLDHSALTVTWELWAVAPDTSVMLYLSEITAGLAYLGLANEFEAISVTLPNHSADPLPAFSTTLEMRYTNDGN